MAKMLIVYHSQSGNTEMLARFVVQDVAATEGAKAILKRASDTATQGMRESDTIVICAPGVLWQHGWYSEESFR